MHAPFYELVGTDMPKVTIVILLVLGICMNLICYQVSEYSIVIFYFECVQVFLETFMVPISVYRSAIVISARFIASVMLYAAVARSSIVIASICAWIACVVT